ncbi:hypothetical protein BASA81_007237 [Batrachochytrium salamandrivorans]|nr:hypothetical protein BASA81_007237 [Batrachochytrium salamandrivorans]
MSLFHFNIPISTNGLFHNPISTNSSITSSNINRSIPNTPFINTSITSTPTTIPITPTISEIRHQRSKYAFERTFQVWGKSKLACSYVQANHASSAKILRSPALSTGQAIGVSLLSLARCGGLWDYPRALKAGLLHPTATDPDQLGSPSRCILCHAHLDCKPMAHLVVDCTHPTVFFARVDTQLLQSINDTRVQIFDCTLHTTTTTTTITTTPASPSLSTATINSNPDPIGASAIWDSRCSFRNSPAGPGHSGKNPTGSRTTTTDTHTAAISSTPTPTHISHIGSDDILTVLLGGSLPGTNTAGNTEACPGQQWLTGVSPEELRITRSLLCGQAFRWVRLDSDIWGGVISQHLVALRQTDMDIYFHFYSDAVQTSEARALLWDYFQLDSSLKSLYKTWSADSNFSKRVQSQGLIGLRVLRQDPVENVFSFICSSNNHITRISSMVKSLCEEYGTFLDSLPDASGKAVQFYSFPEIEMLAAEGVELRLRELGFGYRAKFVAASARMILDKGGSTWLHGLRALPYADAHNALLCLPGVGPKVADCVCLMSLDKVGAIPVDTHVWQIAQRDYGMVGASTKTVTKALYTHIGEAFRKVFGEHAGWAHTVLFCADLKGSSQQ